jgi:competence protein ComEA
VEELDQVPGIGQATLNNMKKDISVGSKKTAPADTVKNSAEKKKP